MPDAPERESTAPPAEDAGHYYRLRPDAAHGAFRTYNAEGETAQTVPATLVEFYAAAADGVAPHEVRGEFAVTAADLGVLADLGWLGLRPGVTNAFGIEWDPSLPVRLTATLLPLWLTPPDFPAIDPADPMSAIFAFLSPFVDAALPGVAHQPHAWQTIRVTQERADGETVGFDWSEEQASNWSGAASTASPEQDDEWPAWMDAMAPAWTRERADATEQQAMWARPECEVRFVGPPDIPGVLDELKVIEGAAGPERVELELTLASAAFADVTAAQLFGLSPESRGPSLVDTFDPGLPVTLTLVLAPALVAEHFGDREVDRGQAIHDAIALIADEASPNPLRECASYTYSSVLQTPAGQSFAVGFENRDRP